MSETTRLTAEQLDAIERRFRDAPLGMVWQDQALDVVRECRRLLGENQQLRDALAVVVDECGYCFYGYERDGEPCWCCGPARALLS